MEIYDISSDIEKLKSENQEWLFEDALSYIGMGKVHYFLTLITGLIITASMTETMGMNLIIKSAECDLQLTSSEKGFLSSVGYLGITLMAFFWGYLSDTRGRRDIMKWTLFCASIASILSSFAPNFLIFVLIRFFVGLLLSASVGSAYPYLGEFTPIKNRQTIMSIASYFFGLSQIYVPVVAWLILPFDFRISLLAIMDYRPWRLLIVFCALPGLVASISLFYFPESPKYCLSQGKAREALEGLVWIYSKNTGKREGKLKITKLKIESQEYLIERTMFKSIMSQVLPLLKPPYIKNLIICFMMSFFIFFTNASLGLWFMEIENSVSISRTQEPLCQILRQIPNITNNTSENDSCDISNETYIDAIVLGVFYTISFILITTLMQIISRGWIGCIFLSASGLCGLSLFWITQPFLILVMFSAFISLGGPVISVVTGTAVLLFPTIHRTMAVCIILILGRLGTVIGSNFIGSFLSVNCEMTMGILTGFILFATCINFLLPFK